MKFGHISTKHYSRFYVKMIWHAYPQSYPDTRTYVNTKHFFINSGMTAHMFEFKTRRFIGFNIMIYRAGIKGFRIEITVPKGLS